MRFVDDLPVRRILPVYRLDPWARTFHDHAGGNHPSVAGSGLRWSLSPESDSLLARDTGRLVASNTATLQAITDFSLFWWGAFWETGATRTLLDKQDAGGVQLKVGLDYSAGDRVFLYDGSNTRTVSVSLGTAKSGCLTLTSGGTGVLYLNGVPSGTLSGASTITGDDADLTLLNAYDGSEPFLDRTAGLLLYAGVLTAPEIPLLHTYSRARFSSRVSPDRQYWDRGSWVKVQQSEDVAAWDFGIVRLNESVDRSGNEHHATHNGIGLQHSELGQAARLNGSTDYLGVADAADLSFGDGSDDSPFSFEAWVKLANATSFPVIGKGILNTDAEWRIFLDASDKIHFRTFDESVADCYIGRTYTTALTSTEGKWTHIVGTYDGSGTSAGFRIYVNGARVDDADSEQNAGSYVAMENLTADVYIGRYDTTYGSGLVKTGRLVNRVLTPAEAASLYRERSGTVLFHETWEMARPTTANATANHTLDGTGWMVESGTWKISEDATWKGPECVSAGTIVYQGVDDPDKWTVTTFEQKAGTPTLNRLSDRLEVDGTAGDKVGEILLTLG